MADLVTTRFTTTGMHCGSCSMLIQMSLEDIEGVESVLADNATGLTEVVYDPDLTNPGAIVHEIVKVGYGAEVAD
ncbi:MAG: cation transporter [Actinomycetota bacterium]|nr:MAG: hypothetical protein FD171_1893 [Actinomycetota bacterium]MDO8950151.1 cation transporter [Actinomycetota bacterium]MDP3630472.1 cation transporter [Actinomycetota bacterium]